MQVGKRLMYREDGKVVRIYGDMMGLVYLPTEDEDMQSCQSIGVIGRKCLRYEELSTEIENAGSCWVVNDEVIVYPKLTVETDKQQITSNGIEISNITVKCVDGLYNGSCNVYVNDVLVQSLFLSNGLLSIPFTSNVPGLYKIIINNELYGENSVMVEVI
jgi:hypothetical protein